MLTSFKNRRGERMRRKARNSLIVIVVLVVILGVGFGIWKIFFAPKPLKIKDLEKATTTIRTANNNGWPEYDPTWNIMFYETTFQYDHLGYIALDNNQQGYVDVGTVYEPLGSMVMEFISNFLAIPLSIDEGNRVGLTYDGGQELIVYLPAIRERTSLYVATDGSTYYNRRLTKLAQKAPTSEEGR